MRNQVPFVVVSLALVAGASCAVKQPPPPTDALKTVLPQTTALPVFYKETSRVAGIVALLAATVLNLAANTTIIPGGGTFFKITAAGTLTPLLHFDGRRAPTRNATTAADAAPRNPRPGAIIIQGMAR